MTSSFNNFVIEHSILAIPHVSYNKGSKGTGSALDLPTQVTIKTCISHPVLCTPLYVHVSPLKLYWHVTISPLFASFLPSSLPPSLPFSPSLPPPECVCLSHHLWCWKQQPPPPHPLHLSSWAQDFDGDVLVRFFEDSHVLQQQ